MKRNYYIENMYVDIEYLFISTHLPLTFNVLLASD